MREKIRKSILEAPGGKILEEFEEENIYAAHGVYAGESRWPDGKHIYVVIQDGICVGKDICDGKTTTIRIPESLADFLGFLRRAGTLR